MDADGGGELQETLASRSLAQTCTAQEEERLEVLQHLLF